LAMAKKTGYYNSKQYTDRDIDGIMQYLADHHGDYDEFSIVENSGALNDDSLLLRRVDGKVTCSKTSANSPIATKNPQLQTFIDHLCGKSGKGEELNDSNMMGGLSDNVLSSSFDSSDANLPVDTSFNYSAASDSDVQGGAAFMKELDELSNGSILDDRMETSSVSSPSTQSDSTYVPLSIPDPNSEPKKTR